MNTHMKEMCRARPVGRGAELPCFLQDLLHVYILFSLSIYTRILPPLERTLGSSTSLVQIAGSVSNLATDLVQSMHPRTR